MATPVVGKSYSFAEMMAEVQKRFETQKAEYEKTNLCLKCKKQPAEVGGVHPFHCVDCNKATNEILAKLRGGPGFVEMKMSMPSYKQSVGRTKR
jgi:hypothetical protein